MKIEDLTDEKHKEVHSIRDYKGVHDFAILVTFNEDYGEEYAFVAVYHPQTSRDKVALMYLKSPCGDTGNAGWTELADFFDTYKLLPSGFSFQLTQE